MKLKQLLFAVTITLFAVSCTKQDIAVPQQENTAQSTNVVQSMSTTEVTNNKAYIFVEPLSSYSMVSSYLRSVPKSPSYSLPFIGFFGVNGDAWKYNYSNYINMPHWYDGRLPQIIQSDVPQTSGGTDTYGNPVVAYNFKTAKIAKNTATGYAWVTVLIPISAMNNDAKKQNKIVVTYNTTSVGTFSTFTTSVGLYGTIINYTGNKIPQGQYRIYSTYPDPAMKLNLNSTTDVYIRGGGN